MSFSSPIPNNHRSSSPEPNPNSQNDTAPTPPVPVNRSNRPSRTCTIRAAARLYAASNAAAAPASKPKKKDQQLQQQQQQLEESPQKEQCSNDWDERDKADYERKKQFGKLTVETIAMREKMEKMQLAFCKAQGMDDCFYNIRGISSKTPIALPPKFKIFDAKKFNGTRDPKQHVRRYQSIAEMKELDEKQTLHAFPLSLTGGVSRWYYSMDPSKTKVWN